MSNSSSRFVLPLKMKDGADKAENLVTIPSSKCTAFPVGPSKICVTDELLSDQIMELPQFNYANFRGRKYRFFYACQIELESFHFPRLFKVPLM